jgi:hypothetical protein
MSYPTQKQYCPKFCCTHEEVRALAVPQSEWQEISNDPTKATAKILEAVQTPEHNTQVIHHVRNNNRNFTKHDHRPDGSKFPTCTASN